MGEIEEIPMSKILAFAQKELYTVFRDRNLILIMFLTPIVLSTIMGLAFGGLGGDSGSTGLADIPIAIVNLDEGFDFAEQIPSTGEDGQLPSLNDLEFTLGGETVNVGALLLQNDNLDVQDDDLSVGNVEFNFGTQLTDILLSDGVTETDTVTDTSAASGFTFDDLTCPLTENDADDNENDTDSNQFGFDGTLADLFDTTLLTDPAAARRGVDTGDYVAAIIIPSGFSGALSPSFGIGDSVSPVDAEGIVEIYANSGQSIKASIVRAVVEGIVNQFVRISIAIDAFFGSAFDVVATRLGEGNITLAGVNASTLTESVQSIDASVIEPLGCMILPNAGNIRLSRQPLDVTQEGSAFSFIMVLLGSAQTIFFALFTGIFGMNSIYDERKNWTLQRLFAAPMPRSAILIGKLLGNIVVVAAQLTILFLAFTVIASVVEGEPTFIWGTNLPLLIAVILAISLFVSGVGVLVVGLAKTQEQVQTFGPIVSAGLGAIGGSFGFRLPPQVAGFSPVWWGTEALRKLAAGETDILLPLVILLGSGMLFFAVGATFFKRRMEL